jgi:hypothetical protein
VIRNTTAQPGISILLRGKKSLMIKAINGNALTSNSIQSPKFRTAGIIGLEASALSLRVFATHKSMKGKRAKVSPAQRLIDKATISPARPIAALSWRKSSVHLSFKKSKDDCYCPKGQLNLWPTYA